MAAIALGHHTERVTKPVEQAKKRGQEHAPTLRHSMVEKIAPALDLLVKVQLVLEPHAQVCKDTFDHRETRQLLILQNCLPFSSLLLMTLLCCSVAMPHCGTSKGQKRLVMPLTLNLRKKMAINVRVMNI